MASERANPPKKMEFFEVGGCETAFEIGFLIGRRFSNLIKNRIASDLILQEQLLPFAETTQAKPLLDELCSNNKHKFPRYWEELVGTAQGSGVPVLDRILSSNVSVGHNYNLVDVRSRRILNVETASRNRYASREAGPEHFFHANMYIQLQIQQEQNESSIRRQKRAAQLPVETKTDALAILGDFEDEEYPIYMKGPTLYTLCTVLIDLDEKTISIFEGNPKEGETCYVLPIS